MVLLFFAGGSSAAAPQVASVTVGKFHLGKGTNLSPKKSKAEA